MAYYGINEGIKGSQAIDFAVLADLGYALLDPAEAEVYWLGAWGQWSACGEGAERQIDHESGADHTRANADEFGVAPAAAFADSVRDVQGIASWRGMLIRIDRASPDFVRMLGDATLEIGFEYFRGEARFDALTTVRDAIVRPFRRSTLRYEIGLKGNAFIDADARVQGALYGPGHEEMTGALDDDREGVDLLGAFGGARGED